MNVFRSAIEGKRLSSVVFVEDYVQLVFDGDVLTMFVWPEISGGSKIFKQGSEGYCDALSRLINRRVVEAAEHPGEQLSMLFSSGDVLSMSLREDDRTGVEAGTFHGTKDRLSIVWN
ncbi:hypothetical protein [Bradyrhizobium sp. Ce-3]|uniref:hypothetical protein n=1 Tax=Bradyrhizobium sp. Ce-3 TaxID=2913970 RepID=UPI001FB9CF07|nr:hypothetical protein [Bradyrhizobium sp. Ce-3]